MAARRIAAVTRRCLALLALAVLPGCPEDVDADALGLAPVAGYQEWDHFEFYGTIAGHGESWRDVFVNASGRDYVGAGRYPVGTVIVKEIRNLSRDVNGAPAPGEIRYLGILRKVGEAEASSVPVEGGWIITQIRDGNERYLPLCWETCHRAAPLDGTFYDYGY